MGTADSLTPTNSAVPTNSANRPPSGVLVLGLERAPSSIAMMQSGVDGRRLLFTRDGRCGGRMSGNRCFLGESHRAVDHTGEVLVGVGKGDRIDRSPGGDKGGGGVTHVPDVDVSYLPRRRPIAAPISGCARQAESSAGLFSPGRTPRRGGDHAAGRLDRVHGRADSGVPCRDCHPRPPVTPSSALIP